MRYPSSPFIGVDFSAQWQRFMLCLLFFVAITNSGCGGKPASIGTSTTDMSRFDALLGTLQERYDLTGSLKITKMKVVIAEGDRHDELRELLWYKRAEDGSELLHIQALGVPLYETRAVVIANRNQFMLRLINEQEAYLGELSDGVLRQIFGIDLRVSDVLSAIFANPFLDGRIAELKVVTSGNKFVVTRPGAEEGAVETIVLFVRDDEPRVTEWRISDKNGELQQRIVFSDYQEVDGILRPHTVEIERPLEETQVVVKIAEVQLNVEIKDSKFDFTPFLTEDVTIKLLTDVPK